MQGLEGEMDTVHAAFLHYGSARVEEQEPGTFDYYHYRERAARFVTVETEYGTLNGAYRPAEEDSYYWRVTQILFPFYHMIPGGRIGEGIKIGAYVPMDDDNHLQWEIGTVQAQRRGPRPLRRSRATHGMDAPLGSRRMPNGTGWHERHRSDQNMDNDYLIDREAQATTRATRASPASASRTAPSPRAWAGSTTARRSTWARRTRSSSARAAA